MKKFIEKIKNPEILIYESILWVSVIWAVFYISYMGMDAFENSIYNFVESILS